MAKQCCVCGKNIGFMEGFKSLDNDKYACDKCYSVIDAYMAKLWNVESAEQLENIKTQAEASIDAKAAELKNPQVIKDFLSSKIAQKTSFVKEHEEVVKKQQEEHAKQQKELEEIKENALAAGDYSVFEGDALYETLCSKLMLTTAGTIEGYKVKKQLGVVFGETVFKPSLGKALVADIGDYFRKFSFSAKEMTGQVSLMEEARKYAYVKMLKSALERGANAVIAIETDNTIGTEGIFYLSLYGTAVYVEPVE